MTYQGPTASHGGDGAAHSISLRICWKQKWFPFRWHFQMTIAIQVLEAFVHATINPKICKCLFLVTSQRVKGLGNRWECPAPSALEVIHNAKDAQSKLVRVRPWIKICNTADQSPACTGFSNQLEISEWLQWMGFDFLHVQPSNHRYMAEHSRLPLVMYIFHNPCHISDPLAGFCIYL